MLPPPSALPFVRRFKELAFLGILFEVLNSSSTNTMEISKKGGNGSIDQRAGLRDIDEVDYTCFCDSLVSKWHTLQNVGNV